MIVDMIAYWLGVSFYAYLVLIPFVVLAMVLLQEFSREWLHRAHLSRYVGTVNEWFDAVQRRTTVGWWTSDTDLEATLSVFGLISIIITIFSLLDQGSLVFHFNIMKGAGDFAVSISDFLVYGLTIAATLFIIHRSADIIAKVVDAYEKLNKGD